MINKKLFWAVPLLSVISLVSVPASSFAVEGVNSLRQTSKAFASVAKQVSPSVVFVKVESTVRHNNRSELPMPFGDELFRRFFGEPFGMNPHQRNGQQSEPRQMSGQGSGFVFQVVSKGKESKSYILTNNHVVDGSENIKVTFQDGKEYDAKVTGSDPKSDVAVLEINDISHPALKLGSSAALDVGEWVIALGNPFGLSHTLTVGVVSAKGRSGLGINDYEDFIQTDAAINPGNSGGPLLNLDGEVIGINTAIFSRSGGYMGVGFAIPADLVQNIANQLISNGGVTRGYLGIVIQEVTAELADSMGLKTEKGILIAQVSEGSAADKAGIKVGDVVTAFQGDAVTEVADFRNRVALTPPGKAVELTIVRNGEQKNIKAQIGNLSESEQLSAKQKASKPNELGLVVQTITEALANDYGVKASSGVVVTQVSPNSVAAMAGIRPGTVVQQVNKVGVNSSQEFDAALAKSAQNKRALLLISDKGMSRYLVLSWR